MKKVSKGYMLVETLIVTTFVSGILVFLFIQLVTLSNNYDDSYKYNTIEGLYALRNIRDYINSDTNALNTIKDKVAEEGYILLNDCSLFSETNYCLKLFELVNVKNIFITDNYVDKELFQGYSDSMNNFVSKINGEGTQKYRILVEFNDSKYATIRFGE